jgi:predicted component of type VI protein secretion system
MPQPKTTFTIGRDRSCDIPIADDSVSRVHAELVRLEDGRWLIRDRQSRNGTRLLRGAAATPVAEEVLALSDSVQLGGVVLPVRDLVDAALSAAARGAHAVSPPAGSPGPGRASDRGQVAPVPGPQPTPGPRPAPMPGPAAVSTLIRCGCGTIKPRGQPCPQCGE